MINLNLPHPLSEVEQNKLVLKIQNEYDEGAVKALTESNLRLVTYTIKKFSNIKMDEDDLFSIGCIGLVKGVKAYRTDKKANLSSFLVRCIENEICMSLRKHKKTLNEDSIETVTSTDSNGNTQTLYDLLYDPDINVLDKLVMRDAIQEIHESLCILSEKEREVVELRYGIRTGKITTQAEIGEIMKLSQSYLSRVESRALRKMREYISRKTNS